MTDSLSVELSEVERVQNPALGAVMLQSFGLSYQKSTASNPAGFLEHFLILPLCLHKPTLDIATHTNPSSGLGKFCEKLSERREELIAVHERALSLRELTLNSIGFGVRANILHIDYELGCIRSLDEKLPILSDRIKPLLKGASRFGVWFQRVEATEIFKALRVEP